MNNSFNLSITVNGTLYEREVEPRLLLSDFLRHDLGLTGTHVGCEHGVCGACTILFDNEPARSCLMFAVMAHGHEVITVEGLGDIDHLSPLQEAFKEEHGLQCGFCTPGILNNLGGFPGRESESQRRRNPRSHFWKSLSLHRLPTHYGSSQAGC